MADDAAAISLGTPARKRGGRRWWVWGAAVLVLGTLTPIGVAWGIALRTSAPTRLAGVGTVVAGKTLWGVNAFRGAGVLAMEWSMLALGRGDESEQALRRRVESWTNMASSTEAIVGGTWPAPTWSRTRLLDISGAPQRGPQELVETGYGWPWVVLWHEARAPAGVRWGAGPGLEGEVVGGLLLDHQPVRVPGHNRVLPLRPAWAGLGMSVAAYSGAWAGLIGGVAGARWFVGACRRRRREKNGCCPQCGYDLRGELGSGCSECGWRRRIVA